MTVVDNASPDNSLETVADLPIRAVRAGRNGGFAAGCNLGIAEGQAPYVLLINPDARIERDDLQTLVEVLDQDPDVGLAAPLILEEDGSMAFSQRRFPRLRSTFAQALFLHRIWPRASWTDELIRNPEAYEHPGSPDWVSGACMLIRREALEAVDGLDEDFFLYCEDIDLCARIRNAGWSIGFEPTASMQHEGGASRAREQLFPVYARNRILYTRKHSRRAAVPLQRLGVALGHATHAITSADAPEGRLRSYARLRGGPPGPAGHSLGWRLAMCGITGAFRIDGGHAPPLPLHVLRHMTEQIEYRGPDDAGFVCDEGCSLGARRLSIIDVEGGHQPFGDERGRIWAAQNGEIYNHESLRSELSSAATCCGAGATRRYSRTSTRSTDRS